jgi:hypothetical protein
MLRIRFEHFDEVERELRHLGGDMPKAAAMAITWAAQAGKQATQKKMDQIFDRPTKWTRESTFLQAANMRTLEATVYIKEGSLSSLTHHVEGGPRRAKASETLLRRKGILRGSNQYIVPSLAMKLDKHGNVRKGLMNKILSSVGAQLDSAANTTAKSLGRNAGQGDFFIVKRQKGTHPGIYRRKGTKARPRLDPVLMFVKSVNYKRRYPFHEIVEDAAYDDLPRAISVALKRISGI